MKSKNCILHIGAPKTGSTALEKFLSLNRAILANSGWIYPDVSLRGFGHHDLAFLIGGGYPDWAIPQEKTLETLTRELRFAVEGRSQIILSSENFYLFSNPGGVAELLERVRILPGSVKVVVYVRRQDDVHISWYNQLVKAQGYTGSIHESIAEHKGLWNYTERLSSWMNVFGKENIIARPYQKEDLLKGDIRYDFLSWVAPDINLDKFHWPEAETNTRINRDILEFQRIINKLPLTYPEKRCFHKELIGLTAATAELQLFDDSPLLTLGERKKVMSSYANANKTLERLYLNKSGLFDQTTGPVADASNAESGLSKEKLMLIMGWIMAKRASSVNP